MKFGKSSSVKKKIKEVVDSLGDKSEFIPYHSYYNGHTILTKNGELLQIIKIEGNLRGDSCENIDGIHATIRDTIRQVVTQSGITSKMSFWLHTVRRKKKFVSRVPESKDKESADSFAEYVGAHWDNNHKWEYEYYNEIYLTILYDGQSAAMIDGKNTGMLLFPAINRRVRNKYIDITYPILDKTVLSVLDNLKAQCTTKRLSLTERATASAGKVNRPSVFYSEMMEFLGFLINIRQENFPLRDLDLSADIQTSRLTIGFNAIESRCRMSGKRDFAAMFSLKQYIDSPVENIDFVLQAPVEFVISQAFVFVPSKKALKSYNEQKYLFDTSGDIKSKDDFGISDVIGFNNKKSVDFCEQQTNIMVLSDDLRTLEQETERFLNSFLKLGLVIIREDIMIEEAFWSQLPGNFEFIRRLSYLATGQAGGFCRLNRFHKGVDGEVRWGNPLLTIPTNVKSPYFFDFHVGDNGHTILYDFNSFGDGIGKILQYFLFTKLYGRNVRSFVFDRNQSARLLFNKLGGSYFPMLQLVNFTKDMGEDNSRRLYLNPFILEPTPHNISFLVSWCGLLISPDGELDDSVKTILRDAISRLYERPTSDRDLPTLVELLAHSHPSISSVFEPWIKGGEYSGLFDNKDDTLDIERNLVGVDMSSALSKPAFSLPLFSYLVHRIISSINEEPAIVIINDALDLFENHFFAPRLESLLEMLRQRNVMVMFTINNPKIYGNSVTLDTIKSSVATHIYIPDDLPVSYHRQNIGLNNHDALSLLHMRRQDGDFLLKQNGESVALKVSLGEAEDIISIFTNDLKSLSIARGRFASMPEDY
ncbi:MAG: hypothetical protein R3D71_00590 [Rickettsiales bacterium]